MTTNLLDNTKISSLRGLLGDDFNEIIDVFFSSAPESIAEAHEACASNNQDVIRERLHSLKGSSANVGASGFSAKCLELELIIKENNGQVTDDQISQLDSLLEQTRQAFETA